VSVGVDDTGYDVKLFGASAGSYMEWDESADQLRIMGASADATTSTGKLLLATSLTNINANDVIGKIDFQAPHETGGTDAITIAASIEAVAQGTFSASVNATDLIFSLGHSEAATEKFRMTSQGEIGIGGANYGSDGQVLTSGGDGAAAAWEDAGGGGATLTGSTNNTVTTVTGADAIIGEANLTFDGTNLTVGTGNVVIGTNGKGIDFSANTDDAAGMTAELLDDYEEGTWTGTFSFGGGQTGNEYSINGMFYTKIGRIVHVSGLTRMSTKGTDTGNAALEGLPFTQTSAGGGRSSGGLFTDKITFTGSTQGDIEPGGTKMNFRQVIESGADSRLSNTNFADASEIQLDFTYVVA
jgi:hypothetical protein